MTDVLLHDLSQQLQILFEIERNYNAGFALGRHILRYWPRHLTTYAQLGQAALAVGLYTDAADLLRRALSAEPLAGELWAGLRQATSALGLKEEADIARQHERDLLSTFGGPGSSDMVRATVAASVEDWPQALRYFYGAYAVAPERMDIALGTAETLYHVQHYESCLSIAHTILTQLPYCLEANLLVVRCGQQLDSAPEMIEPYLQTAYSLDPDEIYASRWFDDLAQQLPEPKATLPAWDEEERWSYNTGRPGH
jgi:tetratricopeptide (TPR) repeat protein